MRDQFNKTFKTEELERYMDSLVKRSQNLRNEGSEFSALEVERIISELASTFNLKQYL